MFQSLLTNVFRISLVTTVLLCCVMSSRLHGSIASENSLIGNLPSEWDVSGIGDPSIQGFATDFSVNRGTTVEFKINTTASAYHIDIYRIGYYGGRGARKVVTINPSTSLPQTQPAFVSDPVTGLVDCGNWAVSASWAVPADATSGVYIARPVRSDNNGASHIIFIVRDDAGASDFLFQTADTTWQAYNNYGGINLYRYLNVPPYRAYKVSYNRPFNNRGGTQFAERESFLFNSEYPMIRWMEANGYDVSYASGMDTDRRGSAVLLTHKVFLSVGHDEYWSGQQRANIEAARAGGVHLGFFSGNEMFWKTRWENSIGGPTTPNRTLVCYKETRANVKIDPSPEWTGTWRDPRFSPPSDGGRPENAVMGQFWTVNAFRTDPMMISSSEGKARFWRNTPIAALADGQTAELPAGVLGFEWDEVRDNGFLPPGLFRLSTTTLAVNAYLQDYGSTFAPATATHSLTLYRHSSGALVFGAGTIQWSWGLDAAHDFTGPPADVRMQQATVNLFADMGVQPATLQPGLVGATASTDTIAPTSVILMPPGGTVRAGSVVTTVGMATDAGGGNPAGVEFSYDGGATWHLATGAAHWSATWTAGAQGLATLKSRAVDDSGKIEIPGPGITIAVGPPSAGQIVSLNFSESTGTTAMDISGKGNHGALLNGAGWTLGKVGSGLGVDGLNDIVRVESSTNLNAVTTEVTVGAWVYRESNQTGWATVASRQLGTGNMEPYFLGISNDGQYRWFVNTVGAGYSSTALGEAAPLGQWVHMMGTYDGAIVRLYVNGVQQYAIAHSGPLADALGGPLTLGASFNDASGVVSEGFQGRIDDFQMYNRALSLSEVQSLYAGSSPPPDLDTTPPVVTAMSPLDGALNVSPSASVTAQFNEAMAPWTVAATNYTYPYPNGGFSFYPVTDTAHQNMLRDFKMGNDLQFTMSQVPDGNYNVYVWTFEDNNSLTARLSVEGAVVSTYTSGPAGRWDRLGPFPVTVADGDIQVRFECASDLVFVSGLEIRQTSGTFYRAINVGGSALTIEGNNWEGEGAPNYSLNGGFSAFTLKDSLNNPVPASISYDLVSRVATLKPIDQLEIAKTYIATLTHGTNGVSDLAGNQLASDVQWTFSSVAAGLAAPGGLAASSGPGILINLAWVDGGMNETGFKIERKTGAGGIYTQIAAVGANVTAYSDSGVTPDTTYIYRVRATNDLEDSAYSPEASAAASGPALRAAASNGAASGVLSLDINKPADTRQGDVMVASIAVRPSSATITTPSGWTLVRRMNNTGNTADSLVVYDKVAGANEPTSYSWTFSTSTGAVGGIQSFSRIDTVNPIDQEAGGNTSNSVNLAAPTVTTQFANDMLVTSHAFSSSATLTPPAGMTEAFDVASDTIPAPNGESIEGNYQLLAAAGATGMRTATASNHADRGNAHTLALKASTSPTNTAPVANAQSVSVAEDGALAITLTGSDADGNSLIFAIGSASHGTVSLAGAVATYTPAANYHGPDSFSFTVNDGTEVSAPTAILITVNEVFADDFIDWLAEHHLLATAETDSDHDSIHNAVEYVIGGDPVTGMDASLLPTCSPAVALPGGNPEDANCIRFTYRRTDRAKNNPSATLKVEWASNLMGPWTNSNVTANVVIDVTDDGFDIGVDRVDVYLPMSLAVESKFFVRLGVTITSP